MRSDYTHDCPAKKKKKMKVRKSKIEACFGVFSSARESSFEPAAGGLRWKDFYCSRREGEKLSKILRASEPEG